MYKTGVPIEVQERNMRPFAIFFIILLPFLFYLLYLHTIADREYVVGKALDPGYHIIDKYPFIIQVDHDETAFINEHQFTYDVNYVDVVIIEQGYVGVIIKKSDRGVNPEPLKPGRYRLNTELYEVEKVYTEPQEYHFGTNTKEED